MQASQGSQLKVFLLGLDATSLTYLQDNLSDLPTFARLLERGRVVKPESHATLLNASMWHTFASGLGPGDLGHYFPMQWDPERMCFDRLQTDPRLSFELFWNRLAANGVKTIVLDAAFAPLNPSDPGIQILDWNTQDNAATETNREDILRQLRRRFGKRPIGDEIPVKKSRRLLCRLRDGLIESVKKKTEAILWLMRNNEWRLFVTAYYEGHRAGHNLWPLWDDFTSDPPKEALLDVYRELDRQIGRLQDELDLTNTAFVVFSMHGMEGGYAQDHFLPATLDRINAAYLQKTGEARAGAKKPRIARMLRQTVPPQVQFAVRKIVGSKVQDWLIDREWRGGRDWAATPSFPVLSGGDTGYIRLNIKGRERDGFLPSSEAERAGYVDFLCESLRELRVKDTGEPLVSDIVFTSKRFPGPRSYLLPDLIVLWNPERPAKEIWSERLGTISAELKTGRGGIHNGDGFAILAGALERMDNQMPKLTDIRDYKGFVTELLGA